MLFQLNWRKKEQTGKDSTSASSTPTNVSIGGGRSRSVSAPMEYNPDSKEHRLRIIFNMFDGNNDGKLTAEEVKDFLSSVYDKKYIENLSSTWNLSKGLTFKEFLEICGRTEQETENDEKQQESSGSNTFWKFKPFSALKKKDKEQEIVLSQDFDENELRRAFEEVFDTNRDGVLTKNEFKKVLKNLRIGEAFNDEEIEQLFDSVVTNNVLKFEHFMALLKDITN